MRLSSVNAFQGGMILFEYYFAYLHSHRIFFDNGFMAFTDCGGGRVSVQLSMQKQLTSEDRLQLLRAADESRKWMSLDDERICSVCNKLLTGRQVDVRRDQRGRFLLHCPTESCSSSPEDWRYSSGTIRAHVAEAHEVGLSTVC
jgi:hypothetical protein